MLALKPIAVPAAVRMPRYREAAYDAIKEAILSGAFAPHQPLVEEQIAAALAISRTPVREALAILEHEGLLVPSYSRGLQVRALTNDEFVALFVANEAVEPFMARQAALFAGEAELAAMAQAIECGRAAALTCDLAAFLRSGRDFHGLLGTASGNAPLTEFVVRNEERTDLYLLSHGKSMDSATMDASNREHEAILQALIQRDPERAARLVIYHAQSLRERFAPLFIG